MKALWQIDALYESRVDFYADNWSCAYNDMVHYRKLLHEAYLFVQMNEGSPKADEWLREYERIEKAEDED